MSNQGKLYKNRRYVMLINKRLFNVAPNKYGKLVCVYDTSPQVSQACPEKKCG